MTFEILKPDESILKLHILYLEKIEKLNNDERRVYVKYLDHAGNPSILVTPPTEEPKCW